MTIDLNQVLDPVTGDYVLPAPPRGKGLLTVEREPRQPAARQAGGASRAIGERFLVAAESLEGLLSELRDRVENLDQAIAEDTRARLKGAVREITSVIDWCDAASAELAVESAKAVAGFEPVDVGALCKELSDARQDVDHPIAVTTRSEVACWADRGHLMDIVQKALAVVWARTGGHGLRCLEAAWRDGIPSIRVCSRGEPGGEIAPSIIEDVRDAVEGAGITVVPDDLGPGGAGLVLLLPV